jgi:sterol desaturase/sphingolipid hydroxylase (fatty acid hydroxylase superfamily)
MPVIEPLAELSLSTLEVWARTNAEPVTYTVFLSFLGVFGVMELLIARSRAEPERTRRWSVNILLAIGWIASGAAVPLSLLAAADWAQEEGIGLLNMPWTPPAAALVIGFLARSLISYLTHVAMHKVPLLWRLHRVHHMDTQLDVSTTARFHPLEALASAPFALAGVVALGIPPTVVLLYEIFDAGVVVFSHANIRLPNWLDRALGTVIVTPNMHRIHHSAFQPETDSNYGATFSFWDRLFGTYRHKAPDDLAALMLGISEVQDRRSQSLFWQLASPMLATTRLRRKA